MSNALINAEVQKLEAGTIVSLFVLDCSEIGGDVLRFYEGTGPDQAPIVWQGQTFLPMPIEVKGFEFRGDGGIPRPSLFVANVFGTFSGLAIHFDDLIGATLTRKRTFAQLLDGMPGASPGEQFPDDVFTIERKASETKMALEFETASSMDVDDVSLPRRQIMANLCGWTYRGPECSYAGPPVADITDAAPGVVLADRGQWTESNVYSVGDFVWIYAVPPMRRYFWLFAGVAITGDANGPPNPTYWKADLCSKRIVGCEKRFPPALHPGGLPFGGFPATARLGQ